jgi:hypothetical protein
MEMWKSVEGYEDLYEVSNFGNMRRIGKNVYLKPNNTGKGYSKISLSRKSKIKQVTIHRLVAKNFIPNPDNKPQVNHIDGDKTNNHVDNLEWVSNQENRTHAVENGLHKVTFGEQRYNSILTDDDVRFIKANYQQGRGNMNSNYFAKKYGVHKQTILNIMNGKKWTHIK